MAPPSSEATEASAAAPLTLTEIPLSYHDGRARSSSSSRHHRSSSAAVVRRYAVSPSPRTAVAEDHRGTQRAVTLRPADGNDDDTSSSHGREAARVDANAGDYDGDDDEETLRGSASATVLPFHLGVVTTASVLRKGGGRRRRPNERILSVSLHGCGGGRKDGEPPLNARVEIDLTTPLFPTVDDEGGDVESSFGPPVRVGASIVRTAVARRLRFDVTNDDGDERMQDDDDTEKEKANLRLVLVDASGSVLALTLRLPTLEACSSNGDENGIGAGCGTLLHLGTLLEERYAASVVRRGFEEELLDDEDEREEREARLASVRPHPGAALAKEQVCFLTSSSYSPSCSHDGDDDDDDVDAAVLLALAPHVYCIDVASGTVSVWRGTDGGVVGASFKERKRRRTTFRGMVSTTLSQAKSVLVGELYDDDYDDDRMLDGTYGGYGSGKGGLGDIAIKGGFAPVAALTVLQPDHDDHLKGQGGDDDDDEEEVDAMVYIGTLHADGSVRLWTVPKASSSASGRRRKRATVRTVRVARPTAVARTGLSLDQDDDYDGAESAWGSPPLPDPSSWDSSSGSTILAGRIASSDQTAPCYALAASIRLSDGAMLSSTAAADRKSGEDEEGVACRTGLVVMSGTLSGAEKEEDRATDEAVTLTVPGGVEVRLVDLSFATSSSVGDLHALLSAESDNGGGGANNGMEETTTILAVYPFASGGGASVDPTPLPIRSNFTIDGNARRRREQILSLFKMSSPKDKDDNDGDATIAATTADVDREFMSKLFRPSDSRRPDPAVVRAALRRLVPSYRLGGGGGGGGAEGNIEAETLSAVRDWARIDETRGYTRGTSTGSPGAGGEIVVVSSDGGAVEEEEEEETIYRSFATPGRRSGAPFRGSSLRHDSNGKGADMDEDDDVEEATSDEAATVAARRAASAHSSRWIKLLLAVLEEEAATRVPLALVSLSQSGASETTMLAIIVRGGTSSALGASVAGETETGPLAALDRAAWSVMQRIQKVEEGRSRLAKLEKMAWEVASTAASLTSEGSCSDALNKQIGELGAWALSSSSTTNDAASGYELSSSLDGAVLRELSTAGRDGVQKWLTSTSSYSPFVRSSLAPGLVMVPISTTVEKDPGSGAATPDGEDTLQSAAFLVRQSLESARCIALARCLVVHGLALLYPHAVAGADKVGVWSLPIDAAQRYLHATAIHWVASQVVEADNPSVSTTLTSLGGSRPPSGAMIATPRFATRTVIDAHLLSHLPASATSGELTASVELAGSFTRAAFDGLPPQTELLRLTYKTEPRLALRLLAPSLAHSPFDRMQNEIAAECLLIEAACSSRINAIDPIRAASLRQLASNLLLDDVDLDRHSLDCADVVFEILRGGREEWWDESRRYSSAQHESLLAHSLQALLSHGNLGSIDKEDIVRLSRLQTAKALFLPWIARSISTKADWIKDLSQQFPETVTNPFQTIRLFALVLLKTSNLMHRLSILQRHMDGSTDEVKTARLCCDLLLSSVQDAISAITSYLPSRMYQKMPEYATLWSSSFRHAMTGHQWDEAYRACLSNPIKERRTNNYRRFVLGVVDAGALGELLRMCLTVAKDEGGSRVSEEKNDVDINIMETDDNSIGVYDGDSIDLYEFAAKTLAEAASEQAARGDAYNSQATTSTTPMASTTSYRACLYTLHSSRGDWRRAAQAIDFYGITAYSAIRSTTPVEGEAKSSVTTRSVMDDISLSAQGAAHAIHLVDQLSHRFVVSGEIGPHPPPLLGGEAHFGATIRGLSGDTGSSDQTTTFSPLSVEANKESRISRLLSERDLARRAVMRLALRILHMDSLSPDLVSTFLNLSTRDVIDALSQLGYSKHALAVAQGMRAKRKSCPKGLDIFYDAVRYMLCTHLAPSVVRLLRPLPRNAAKGNDWERSSDSNANTFTARPTVAQLDHSSDGESTIIAESWRSTTMNDNAVRGAQAMNLLRQYTMSHSNKSNQLALSVADAMLDLDGCRAELPLWLLNSLLGRGVNAVENSSGFFAMVCPENESHVSDPAGLVRLYMKRGLYIHACNAVTTVLLGLHRDMNVDGNRAEVASSRLPERGNIDYVPYNTIDTLWDMIDEVASTVTDEEKTHLFRARSDMEDALTKHFELMKVSEEGLKSARALAKA